MVIVDIVFEDIVVVGKDIVELGTDEDIDWDIVGWDTVPVDWDTVVHN
jgi:hypothetical protein